MLKTYTIPSVIEANSFELNKVAPDLLHGLRIFDDRSQTFLVGDLSLSEGSAPHKTLNSSPDENDYRLLSRAGMLIASKENDGAMYLTTGFPSLSYQVYRDKAVNWLQNNHVIRYDSSTFADTGVSEQHVSVVKTFVIPELAGCNITIRDSEPNDNSSFFIVSMGYGTFEAALSTESGLIQRTMVSGPGLRYAITGAAKELMRTHFIGLKTENQFDYGFREGKIVLNRQLISLLELRKKALHQYYAQVISPLLAKSFTDADFSKASSIVLLGGGALYDEIIEDFSSEFSQILPVKVFPEPTLAAAKGYAIHSRRNAEGANVNAVGLDIGNANTVVSIHKEASYGGF
ncbi:MAG: hypothetical protein CVU11_02435 [Bacteroidetes bacterium HGW-Bacteroidetes-6]|jgi:hypothetical protein|nr:MAG: hypothetical protein CVU11_02435 [Bacteroidetes bacterium HGW-Bacteroidetes-6]